MIEREAREKILQSQSDFKLFPNQEVRLHAN